MTESGNSAVNLHATKWVCLSGIEWSFCLMRLSNIRFFNSSCRTLHCIWKIISHITEIISKLPTTLLLECNFCLLFVNKSFSRWVMSNHLYMVRTSVQPSSPKLWKGLRFYPELKLVSWLSWLNRYWQKDMRHLGQRQNNVLFTTKAASRITL